MKIPTGPGIPPTRLCVCGHNYSVHRGPCRVVIGCDCTEFEEEPAPLRVLMEPEHTVERRPRGRS